MNTVIWMNFAESNGYCCYPVGVTLAQFVQSPRDGATYSRNPNNIRGVSLENSHSATCVAISKLVDFYEIVESVTV